MSYNTFALNEWSYNTFALNILDKMELQQFCIIHTGFLVAISNVILGDMIEGGTMIPRVVLTQNHQKLELRQFCSQQTFSSLTFNLWKLFKTFHKN